MRRPGWLDLLTYLSVIAALVMLVRGDLLGWPRILHPQAVAGAFVLLLAGFLASVLAWRSALAATRLQIPFRDALASSGLSVFGKYLPGKVWLIAGMAGYVARHHPIAIHEASAAATRMQVVSIWVGLVLGLPALLMLEIDLTVIALGAAAMAIGTGVLANGPLRARLDAVTPRLGRALSYLWPRSSPIPPGLVIWLALTWLAWGIGFALLTRGLTAAELPWTAMLVFPLAAVVGLLVLIAPGGIGAREGVLALALSALALSPEQVTAVAVFSRLWYLLGEVAMFVLGSACARKR